MQGFDPETTREGGCYAMPSQVSRRLSTAILVHMRVIEFMSYAVVSTTARRVI